MTVLEDFVISEPYQRTQDDDALIAQVSPNDNHSSDWEDNRLTPFRHRVRDYYLDLQNRRCIYCRTKIKTGQAPAEVEHIVAKSNRPEWMYEPFNLAVVCKSCNTKKSTKKILTDKDTPQLPHDSTQYKIIQPHIDRYSEHINILDGIFYEGLTDKGKETIKTCELFRYELAADRADDIIQRGGDIYNRAMLALVSHDESPLVDNIDKFIKRIEEIIQEFKEENND